MIIFKQDNVIVANNTIISEKNAFNFTMDKTTYIATVKDNTIYCVDCLKDFNEWFDIFWKIYKRKEKITRILSKFRKE